jgi:hypothetical protein
VCTAARDSKKGDNNLDPRQETIIRQRIIFSEIKENKKERQRGKWDPHLMGTSTT